MAWGMAAGRGAMTQDREAGHGDMEDTDIGATHQGKGGRGPGAREQGQGARRGEMALGRAVGLGAMTQDL